MTRKTIPVEQWIRQWREDRKNRVYLLVKAKLALYSLGGGVWKVRKEHSQFNSTLVKIWDDKFILCLQVKRWLFVWLIKKRLLLLLFLASKFCFTDYECCRKKLRPVNFYDRRNSVATGRGYPLPQLVLKSSQVFYCFQNEKKYIICSVRNNWNNKANPKGQCPASRVT